MKSTSTHILKVKDWLNFSKPDFDGFKKHVDIWVQEGIPYNLLDLVRLSKKYNLLYNRDK